VLPQFIPVLGDWRFAAYGVVVIGMTMFRPAGLLGDRPPRIELPTSTGSPLGAVE
jgi:hypothetical protein